MSDETKSDVLGGLPRSRPHRRSEKRPARPADGASSEHPDAADEASTAPAESANATKPVTPTTTDAPSKAAPPAKPAARTKPPTPRKPSPSASTAAGQARPAAPKPQPARAGESRGRLAQPAQPTGTPDQPRARRAIPPSGAEIVSTAVQAAAELAEIGLSVSARAIRTAVSKLPRP